MAANRKFSNPVQVSEAAGKILDPVLRKRAGISVGLVQSWEEIVGPSLCDVTRPERVIWPRRDGDEDDFKPATLVVCCSGANALHLQHQSGEVIGRVNAYLGFPAIGRLRIVQKPVGEAVPRPLPPRQVTAAEAGRIDGLTAKIEHEELRASLARLGRSVIGSGN